METRDKVILDVEMARHGEKLDAMSLWVFGGRSGGIPICRRQSGSAAGAGSRVGVEGA